MTGLHFEVPFIVIINLINPNRHAETKDHEVPDLRLSGLRISDLLSLRWEQLFNEDDKFVIYEKKTNKTIKNKIDCLKLIVNRNMLSLQD